MCVCVCFVLVKDSLGGNTKTTFIVTLSPSEDALEETVSTLQFANRAKQVTVHASVNEVLDDESVIRQQAHEIARYVMAHARVCVCVCVCGVSSLCVTFLPRVAGSRSSSKLPPAQVAPQALGVVPTHRVDALPHARAMLRAVVVA